MEPDYLYQLALERDSFFNLSLDIFCITDFDGYVKRVNPAVEKILGWKPEELMSNKFVDYIHQDDLINTLQQFDLHKKGAGAVNFVNRYLAKDGTHKWISWNSFVLISEKLIFGIGRDITESKKAEESMARLASIVESSDDGMISKDLTGTIKTWNRAAERLFGYTASEIIGRSIYTIIPSYLHFEEEYVLNKLRHSESIEHFETERVRKDGKMISVWLTISPIKNEYGKVIGASKIVRDITYQKKMEAELLKKDKILENAQALAHVGSWEYDFVNDTSVWSDEMFNITGFEKYLGVPSWDEQKKRIVPHYWELIDKVKNEPKTERVPRVLEYEIIHPRKGIVSVRTIERAEVDKSGKVVKLYGTTQDITEDKKVEEIFKRDKQTLEEIVKEKTRILLDTQVELERSKHLSDIGALATTVAHEMRNPLAAINTSVANLRNKVPVPPPHNRYLDTIEKKIMESDQIINNLLFYSKIKPPSWEVVNIAEIVHECAEHLHLKKNISMGISLDAIANVLIEADSIQMKEVFSNIIGNAYDAVSDSNGRIEINGKRSSNSITISVKDNGPGISQKDKDRILNPFFTTKAKGTGLGLTVCNQIIKQHKGSIEIKSELGHGTTVVVTLPKKKDGY